MSRHDVLTQRQQPNQAKLAKYAERNERSAMIENPFTPTFGTVPFVMAGRDELLSKMNNAFIRENRDPLLSTLLIGARGTGKTALLTCIKEQAERAGWIAASTIALPGLLEDIFEQASIAGEHLIKSDSGARLTSIAVGPLSVSWEKDKAAKGNWRTRMTRLLDQLAAYDTGLLITVDEAKADIDEIIRLVSTYQMFVAEGRKVALVMAGLPFQVHRLISHKSISFVRRAQQFELGTISDADVENALIQTFERGGKQVSEEALTLCVDAINGFPYFLQLVGYRVWDICRLDSRVETEAARKGILQAKAEMEEHVLAATYRELSAGDIRYLQAMLQDKKESRTSKITARLGVSSGYASKYKSRLLAQGVIGEPARGWVSFEIPGFREYLETRLQEENES